LQALWKFDLKDLKTETSKGCKMCVVWAGNYRR
jgi:hypothetical protein